MSVQAISWVLDHSKATLGSRLVLISIANHARADGTGSWPSVGTMARESHLSEREVRYCLRDLEDIGELQTTRGGGRGKSSLYSLPKMVQTLPPLEIEKGQPETERGQSAPEKGQPIAPEPSFNRPKENRNSFVAPTHHEVSLYMLSRGVEEPETQAEVFIAHHANRGWRLSGGRGPLMKDWQMAVTTWCANIQKFKTPNKGFDFEEENRRALRRVFGKSAN